MEYRITLTSNPKIILLIVVTIALPVVGVLSFFVFPIIMSVIIAAAGFYFAYHLVKFLISTLGSHITTREDGVLFHISRNDDVDYSWDAITHAGLCASDKKRRTLYVYQEDEDKLVTVPNDYDRFDELIGELRAHVEVPEARLAEGETVRDHLRRLIGLPEQDEEEPQEEEPQTDESEETAEEDRTPE
jgi:hypothetical protein